MINKSENKRKKVDKCFEDECDEFVLSGNFLCSEVQPKRCILFSEINIKKNINSFFTFFSLIFSYEILDFIIKEINDNFLRKNKIDQNKQNKSKYRPIDMDEFLRWLGIQILIENTFGNDNKNLSSHFKSVCKSYKINFSYSRFQKINNSFILDNESINYLCELLIQQNYSLLSSIDILTVDECLIGYKPSNQTKEKYKKNFDEIPLVYIPRKPHPNGLLIYLSSTEVFFSYRKNKISFVLDIFPNLNSGFGLTPYTSILKILQNYPENLDKPVFICDAAFGSIDMGKRIIDFGGDFHFSMSSNQEKNIWEILSYKLLENTSRVCKNTNNGFLFSCNMIRPSENNISYQNIMSSFFTSSGIPSSELISSELPSFENSTEIFSEILPTSDILSFDNFPIYSKKELKKMKRDELRGICKNYNISFSNKLKKDLKEDLVKKIYETSKNYNLKGSKKRN